MFGQCQAFNLQAQVGWIGGITVIKMLISIQVELHFYLVTQNEHGKLCVQVFWLGTHCSVASKYLFKMHTSKTKIR